MPMPYQEVRTWQIEGNSSHLMGYVLVIHQVYTRRCFGDVSFLIGADQTPSHT